MNHLEVLDIYILSAPTDTQRWERRHATFVRARRALGWTFMGPADTIRHALRIAYALAYKEPDQDISLEMYDRGV